MLDIQILETPFSTFIMKVKFTFTIKVEQPPLVALRY